MFKLKTKRQMALYFCILAVGVLFVLWTIIYVQGVKRDFINNLELDIGRKIEAIGFNVDTSGNTSIVKRQLSYITYKNDINIHELEMIFQNNKFNLEETSYIDKFKYEYRLYKYNEQTFFSSEINAAIKIYDSDRKTAEVSYLGSSSKAESISWTFFFIVFIFGVFNLDELMALWKK